MKRANLKAFVPFVFLLLSTLGSAQGAGSELLKTRSETPSPRSTEQAKGAPPAEDISGMYSFLREGEFVQINLEQNTASGYISRRGDLESDRGAFLDQFFDKASVHGHEVAFVTKPLHGVSYEFTGRFERGPAKSKAQDGYYILRGTLKETNGSATSRSREVVFKSMAQPPEDERNRDR